MMKALVAYYSWSGCTQKIAELIARETGGDLFRILPAAPYPDSYNAVAEQAKREIQVGARPAIAAMPGDLADYDHVFVGTPNWWSTIAPPVATFLDGADLTGKRVAPFCTHGGGGQARCATDTAKLCPGAEILTGLTLYGDGGQNARQEITAWLQRIGK